jgi:hypothetical protein
MLCKKPSVVINLLSNLDPTLLSLTVTLEAVSMTWVISVSLFEGIFNFDIVMSSCHSMSRSLNTQEAVTLRHCFTKESFTFYDHNSFNRVNCFP